MAALNVPKNERLALTILRQLPEPAFDQLVAELERSPTAVPKIPNLSPDDTTALSEVIESLHRVRAYSEVSLEEFASDVCESLFEHNDLTPATESAFRERLLRILSIGALAVAGKAVALHLEYDHVFCRARVLTDARPIFGEDVSAPPPAMMITHTLKLDFHTGPTGRIEEFYITLGSGDLQVLQYALQRAEIKAKSLGTAIKNTNVRLVDPQQ